MFDYNHNYILNDPLHLKNIFDYNDLFAHSSEVSRN